MPCFHPIPAWRREGEAKLCFSYRSGDRFHGDLKVPCGQCVGCRLDRSRQWAVRCMHEAASHEKNCFITLTFSPEYLHVRSNQWSLDVRDFQLFMKRLRKRFGKGIRFYHCGEYGEMCSRCDRSFFYCQCGVLRRPVLGRPHYHACIFGFDFPDKELFKITETGSRLYISKALDELWTCPNTKMPMGFSTIGDVTFESAAYVARYIMKKVNGDLAYERYYRFDTGEVLKSEYTTMSRRPGIGRDYFLQYMDDIYPHDYVVINGRKVKPPRYYDGILKVERPYTFDDVKFIREENAKLHLDDNTSDRLKVKEAVQLERLQLLTRDKDF